MLRFIYSYVLGNLLFRGLVSDEVNLPICLPDLLGMLDLLDLLDLRIAIFHFFHHQCFENWVCKIYTSLINTAAILFTTEMVENL